MRTGFIFILILILSSCGTSVYYQKKAELYPTWPQAIQQAITDNEILIGMNKEQVQYAINIHISRIKKRNFTDKNGTTETWRLWRGSMFNKDAWCYSSDVGNKLVIIHFDKSGKVSSITY